MTEAERRIPHVPTKCSAQDKFPDLTEHITLKNIPMVITESRVQSREREGVTVDGPWIWYIKRVRQRAEQRNSDRRVLHPPAEQRTGIGGNLGPLEPAPRQEKSM